jgi:tetratricopeptide (TPR) repeat protein
METAARKGELRTTLRPPRGVLVELAARAYYDAAMTGAPMADAVQVLETYRAKALESRDLFAIWDELDALAVGASESLLETVAEGVRRRYAEEVVRSARAAVQAAFEESSERGWYELLRTHGCFCAELRTSVCLALVEQDLAVPAAAQPDLERLRIWTRRMERSEWREAGEGFTWLVDNADLTPYERARLFISASQVQLFTYSHPDLARQWIERAAQVDDELPEVHCAWGDYWVAEGALDKARASFEKALESDPKWASAYCGMGDVHVKGEQAEEAERCFLKATELAPGDSTAYDSLLDLYGGIEWFAEHEPRLDHLAACRIASSPDQEYTTCMKVGDIYRQNSRYEKAESWYRRAIALDGSRGLAFTSIGELYLDQDDEPRAREAMERSIELEPDLFDGYWGMGTLREQSQDYGEAARWYLESLRRYPQWEPAIVVRVTDLQTRAGRHDEAEATLFEHLELHPEDEDLRGALAELALAIARDLDDRARAIGLFDRLLHVRGPDFEADRHELVGDLMLALDDVEGALEAFGRAVAVRPDEPRFHRKVAGAERKAARWDQSHQELWRALELDKDEEAFRRESALVFNDAGNEKVQQSAAADAVELFKQAIAMDPDDAVMRSNLAVGYEMLAQAAPAPAPLEGAVQALRDALRLDPDSAEYAAQLERLEGSLSSVRRYGAQVLTAPTVAGIVVEVADDLVPTVDPQQEGAAFFDVDIPAMRERIEADCGAFPYGVRLRPNPALSGGRYRVLLWEVLEVEGEAVPNSLFALGSGSTIAAAVPPGAMIERTDPVTGVPGTWVPATLAEPLREATVDTLTVTEFLIRHLEAVVRSRLYLLLGLDAVDPIVPPSEPEPQQIARARVLRALARDRLPLRTPELDAAFLDADLTPAGAPGTIRNARLALAHLLPGNRANASAVPVPDWAEEALEAPGSSPPRLTPVDEHRLLVELGELLRVPGPCVVVTESADHRPYLQRLVANGLGADVAVVDAAERARVTGASPKVA